MSSGPANAQLNGEGFRFYRWTDVGTGETHDLLSVTSIRKLCGENYGLVNWQLNNIIDGAMGTVKRPAIGKRGKPLKGKYTYVPEQVPSEFVTRYLDALTEQEDLDDSGQETMVTVASQPKLDALRKWLREESDQPRNIAARRGTMVHEALERNVAWHRIERPWVEAAFENLSAKDRAAAKAGVTDADVLFVRRAVANYWDMRANVPFVILAREPQVFNLSMGYGGSADVIIWCLPDGVDPKSLPPVHTITLDYIKSVGGWLAVGDWKTSTGVYTDHIVQVHAYGAGEFIGQDGVINHRLTEILQATQRGVLFHIRPDGWSVHPFDFNEPTFLAFAGSVAFARFLAQYPRPGPLFIDEFTGAAPEESEWAS